MPENSTAGESVGNPVTATDGGGDALTYALTGSDDFTVNNSGQIMVATGATLDYETTPSYSVTVTVHDGKNSEGGEDASVDDTIEVTITILNVDEAGTVALNAETPQVGSAVTASVTDPDGSVTGVIWTWESSADGTTWAAIAGVSGGVYTPSSADAGKYLRATASYADGHGSGKSAQAVTTNKVDGGPPRVISVDIVSSPRSGDTYREGEYIFIAATFSESVEPVVESGLVMRLTIGGEKKLAWYGGPKEEGKIHVFYHLVYPADMDADGVSVEKNQLFGEAAGAGGTAASLEHSAMPDQAGHQVYGGAPRITSMAITSTPANSDAYSAGEEIKVRVTFSEPVSGVRTLNDILNEDISEGSRPVALVVNIGRATHFFVREATETTWIFTRSVRGIESAVHGISIPANGIFVVPHGVPNKIKDADGNIANLDHPALPADLNHKVVNVKRPSWLTNSPAYYDIGARTRFIPENTPAGENVGTPLTALDSSRYPGEPPMIYNIVGRDARAFDLDSSTGRILVKDALDYETKSSYSVTVAVDDGVINPVADAGKYLRAVASYTNGHGSGKSAQATTANQVY